MLGVQSTGPLAVRVQVLQTSTRVRQEEGNPRQDVKETSMAAAPDGGSGGDWEESESQKAGGRSEAPIQNGASLSVSAFGW